MNAGRGAESSNSHRALRPRRGWPGPRCQTGAFRPGTANDHPVTPAERRRRGSGSFSCRHRQTLQTSRRPGAGIWHGVWDERRECCNPGPVAMAGRRQASRPAISQSVRLPLATPLKGGQNSSPDEDKQYSATILAVPDFSAATMIVRGPGRPPEGGRT
jgi:hypothetical protein